MRWHIQLDGEPSVLIKPGYAPRETCPASANFVVHMWGMLRPIVCIVIAFIWLMISSLFLHDLVFQRFFVLMNIFVLKKIRSIIL